MGQQRWERCRESGAQVHSSDSNQYNTHYCMKQTYHAETGTEGSIHN